MARKRYFGKKKRKLYTHWDSFGSRSKADQKVADLHKKGKLARVGSEPSKTTPYGVYYRDK